MLKPLVHHLRAPHKKKVISVRNVIFDEEIESVEVSVASECPTTKRGIVKKLLENHAKSRG